MFILILGMWTVIVFALRVAIFGNPLNNLVQTQPLSLLDRLDQRVQDRELVGELTGPERNFVQRFSRMALLEVFFFGLEIGILAYLILSWEFSRPGFYWFILGLLGKNLLIFVLSWFYSRALRKERALFRHLLQLPRWLITADRLSAAVSASVFILLILKIAGLWPATEPL